MDSKPMRFGVALWAAQTSWPAMLETAKLVDRLGYDSLRTDDHLLADFGPPNQPKFEAWTTVAAWAAVTEHVHLGHFVLANTFRHPVVLAKMAVTLDHISGGRAILGLGSGWFELEHTASGIDFGRSAGERLDWMDEATGILRRLLDGETVTHDGPRYHLHEMAINPLPLQQRLPILIGGLGEKKTLRTVARYADIWDTVTYPDLETLRSKYDVLAAHCQAAGRDLTEIEVIVNPTVIIRDDVAAARAIYDAMIRHNGAEPDPAADPWLGPPDAIAERMRSYIELDFRHVCLDLPAPYDRETIERFIGQVKPLVAVI